MYVGLTKPGHQLGLKESYQIMIDKRLFEINTKAMVNSDRYFLEGWYVCSTVEP